MGSLRSLLSNSKPPKRVLNFRYEIHKTINRSFVCLDWESVNHKEKVAAQNKADAARLTAEIEFYETVPDMPEKYNEAWLCKWGAGDWRVHSSIGDRKKFLKLLEEKRGKS